MLLQNGIHHQVLASVAAALAGFNSGMWRVWPSLAIRHLKSPASPFLVTKTDLSFIASLSYASYFLSPFLCRYSIRFGRKFCLATSLLLFVLTWSAARFATNAYILYAASISAGFGNGLSSIVVPIYIAEIAAPSIRGTLVSGYVVTFTLGQIFTAGVGIRLNYDQLNLAGLAFSIFSFVFATIFVRETPQHHLIVGADSKAKTTYRYFHNPSAAPDSKDGDEGLEEMKKKIEMEMTSKSSFRELLATAGSRRAVSIICLVSSFQMLAGTTSLISFSSLTLPHLPDNSRLTPHLTVLLCLVLGVVSNFLGSYLIDLAGRRVLLAVSSLLGALITSAFAILYFIYDTGEFHGNLVYVPYALIMSYFFVYYLGMGIVRAVFIGELFPANIKVHASMVSILSLSAASFFVNFIYLHVSSLIGVYAMFIIFTISNVCNFLSAIFVVIETKGKTLFEIQEYFKNLK